MGAFRIWFETVDLFPRPEDLLAFFDHAMTVVLRTQQKMFHTAHSDAQKHLLATIVELMQLLREIHGNIEHRLGDPDPLNTDHDKFKGHGQPSLAQNQYQHRFKDFASVFNILKKIGGHYFVEPVYSRQLTEKLLRVQEAHSKVQVDQNKSIP